MTSSTPRRFDVLSENVLNDQFWHESAMNAHKNSGYALSKSWGCVHCVQTFSTKQSQSQHRCSVECNQYKCEECPQAFHNSILLREDVTQEHLKPNRYQCSVCFLGYATHEEVALHMHTYHSNYTKNTGKKHYKRGGSVGFVQKFMYRLKCLWWGVNSIR